MTPRAGDIARLADVLPEYEVLGELGRGAMGVVLSARHRSLDRPVAIKQLPGAFASDEAVRSRFLREAKTVAGLDHPHVVGVYDFIDRGGHLALVMEELPGGTVWDHFVASGVTPAAACGLILGTAAGLAHAHGQGVLHRDVKPENLMFAANGQLKVTDFGIAKVMGGNKTLATADGVILGTPAYMSPEQAEGREVVAASDIYACGTMLYELLSGVLPFPDAGTPLSMLVARLKADAPPIRSVAPAVPPLVAEVVDRSLAREVGQRRQQVEEFAVDLARAAADSWGTDWLEACGVRVTGSHTIESAARTTGAGGNHGAGPQVLGLTVTAPRGEAGPEADPAAPTAVSETADTTANQAVTPTDALGPVVVPDARMFRPARDYSRISLSEIVDITEVGRPPRPAVPMLLAVVLAATGLLVAVADLAVDPAAAGDARSLVVNGQAVGRRRPLELDLARPFSIDGLPAGADLELAASVHGLPLGVVAVPVTSSGSAEVDPAYLRWTTAATVELSIIEPEAEAPLAVFPATTTHPWYTTAPTVAASVLGLFGLATCQSNIQGLRRGRIRLGAVVGLLIGGGLIGLAAGVIGAAALGGYPAVPTLAAVSALISVSAAAVGEGYRRRRRRRRLSYGLAV